LYKKARCTVLLMTKTHSTATAAHAAQVSPRTIRRWAANGRVSATKVNGRWVIDAASLNTHVAATIADRADYTAYKDQGKARDNVYNLLADGALIPLIESVYLVVSKTTDGINYIVNTVDQTCDCRSHQSRQYCSHLTSANAIEASKSNARTALQLAA
jgi:hypothetical protein